MDSLCTVIMLVHIAPLKYKIIVVSFVQQCDIKFHSFTLIYENSLIKCAHDNL